MIGRHEIHVEFSNNTNTTGLELMTRLIDVILKITIKPGE